MCGRFVAATPVSELAEILDVAQVDMREPDGSKEIAEDGAGGAGGAEGATSTGEDEPRFNVAPQTPIWVVRPLRDESGQPTGERKLVRHRWGLVPPWSKDPNSGARMFNARSESLAEKSSFRTPLAKRRCLIPADAFYEWKAVEGSGAGSGASTRAGKQRKQPYLFRAADGGLVVFAGLWEYWKPHDSSTENEDGGGLLTCTILTTAANEMMSGYHDRMPVILQPEDWDRWLAPGELSEQERAALLSPPPEDYLEVYPVSPKVGDARAEGPELIEPLPPEGESDREAEGRLFPL